MNENAERKVSLISSKDATAFNRNLENIWHIFSILIAFIVYKADYKLDKYVQKLLLKIYKESFFQ